jgi:hypothetical protein
MNKLGSGHRTLDANFTKPALFANLATSDVSMAASSHFSATENQPAVTSASTPGILSRIREAY